MSDTILTTGKTVTEAQRLKLANACYVQFGKGVRFDKCEAVKAIITFYETDLDTPVVFRATKRHKGEWRSWVGTHWQLYHDFAFAGDIIKLLDGTIDDKQLTSILAMVSDRSSKNYYDFDKSELIAFENTCLYRDGRSLRTKMHDRADYSTFDIPHKLENAKCPEWRKLVARTLPSADDQARLQELFGYCLFPSYQGQVFFILHGAPGTGKGTLMEVLERIVGRERYTGVRMDTLGETHGLAPLKNSYVNFDPETAYVSKEGENILKFSTGGGDMTINEKYEKQITVPLTVRFVMSCNTLPKFNDRTDALWQRIVLIPFENPVPLDKTLAAEIVLAKVWPELSGVIGWAIKGLMRLLERGCTRSGAFTPSKRADEILSQHRLASDHFRNWYQTFVEKVEDDKQTLLTKAYEHYCTWSRRSNYSPCGKDIFVTAIENKGHKVGRPGQRGASRSWQIAGIDLQDLATE
jgi:P4 family phage/plasmid primase-like protien